MPPFKQLKSECLVMATHEAAGSSDARTIGFLATHQRHVLVLRLREVVHLLLDKGIQLCVHIIHGLVDRALSHCHSFAARLDTAQVPRGDASRVMVHAACVRAALAAHSRCRK